MSSSGALKDLLRFLIFGARFRVSSQRGNNYVLRFLYMGEADSGIFVRLDDGQIVRLEQRRLRWSTCDPASDLLNEPAVGVADELLVHTNQGVLRGNLLTPLEEGVSLRLRDGRKHYVPREQVDKILLLFKTQELRAGDRFVVRSLSGTSYRGQALELINNRAKVRLHDGEQASVNLDRWDLNTLHVGIPIPFTGV